MLSSTPRFYRKHMGLERFKSFSVQYKDSDLWIGVDLQSFHERMPVVAMKQLLLIRKTLEAYIEKHPAFVASMKPLTCLPEAPAIAVNMALAALRAGTGPMASVAGAFAHDVGRHLQQEFSISEIIVENGGDIYLSISKPLTLAIYAGSSPLSGKIGLEIPPHSSPMGVCTSAGTFGPSVSFGKADAVMVACTNPLLADALATSLGNMVKKAADIENTIEIAKTYSEITSLVIVCEGKIGISGAYPVKPMDNLNLNTGK